MAPPGANYVYYMNMNDSTEFMTVENANRSRPPRAIKWILEGPVAVMVTSNMGRPGGACSHTIFDKQGHMTRFQFQDHANARTQEESLLSFICTCMHPGSDKMERQLKLFICSYGMGPPTGRNDLDFNVKHVNTKGTFNVRTSNDPSDYAREFGSSITIHTPHSTKTTHKIYLSYIAGPNTSEPCGAWDARGCQFDQNQIPKLDTVFRTISKPAYYDYELFKRMLSTALVASLKKMASLEYKRVIMAAPSTGLYAGRWKDKIQFEFHKICRDALSTMHSSNGYTFDEVLVPRF